MRDLQDKLGALTACSSTKQQTFIAEPEVFTGNILAGAFTDSKVAGTETANQGKNYRSLLLGPPTGELYENHGIDGRYTGPYEVSPTLSARAGTGGNNLPLCIAGNIIDRQSQNGGNGLGCQENIAYTLTATDRLSGYPDKRSNPED